MKLIDIPIGYIIFIYGKGYGGKIYKEIIKELRKDLKIYFIDDNDKNCYKLKDLQKFNNFYILNSIITPTAKDIVDVKIKQLYFDKLIEIDNLSKFLEHKIPFFHLMNKNVYLKNKYIIKNILRNLSLQAKKQYKKILYYRILTHYKIQLLNEGWFFSKFSSSNDKKQYLEFIPKKYINTIIEGGVFDGKSSLSLIKHYQPKVIYGFDPLNNYLKYKNPKLKLIKKALWDKRTTLYFEKKGSASSITQKSDIVIKSETIDEFSKHKKIDFIKLDVEGAELNVLKGALKTIQKDRPFLAISIYHSIEDFIFLTHFIIKNTKNYIYKIGMYDNYLHEIVLYALPKEKIKGFK